MSSAIWIIEIVISYIVLFAIQIPLRMKEHRMLRTLVFAVKVFLILATALLFVAIECRFSYRHGDILNAVYIVLAGDVLASIVEYVIRGLLRRNDDEDEHGRFRFVLYGVLSMAFCLCIFLYGTWNAGNITVKEHTWKAEGLKQAHTFAFVADIHSGSSQSMDTIRKMCRDINESKPEFVVLGGDMTDELTSYDDMVETYKILSEVEAPMYFIYGNHDRQPDSDYLDGRTYQDEQMEEEIRKAGITILSDEYAKLDDDLVLLGREDRTVKTRKSWDELENPYEGTGALIVADHAAYDSDQLDEEKSALQLSGHTHAGQLWPLQMFYRMLRLPAYGEFRKPGTLLYVSAGASDWMMPFRTEEHCEWDLITLEP